MLTAPAGAAIHARLTLDTSAVLSNPSGASRRVITGVRAGNPQQLMDPGATEVKFQQSLEPQHIALQGRYVVDHGNPGYASVTRVIADRGSIAIDGDSLVIDGVH
jgi:hypothetical protein